MQVTANCNVLGRLGEKAKDVHLQLISHCDVVDECNPIRYPTQSRWRIVCSQEWKMYLANHSKPFPSQCILIVDISEDLIACVKFGVLAEFYDCSAIYLESTV